jgi:tRNA(Ile)-lysidine synthase
VPVEHVREAVRRGGLLAGPEPLVAMISGGRDSTCLLDVAVALRGAGSVAALHVNYGLREAARDDEARCSQLCEQLGVALEVVRVARSPSASGSAPPGNLQAWAREVRYEAAQASARRAGALLASGHTASDQVETILYRLAASPGRRALLGMRPREGSLLRPLLSITREQTAAYCGARGLRWCEDESNADPGCARPRGREGLLPALMALHPAARENVLRTAALLREDSELIDGLVDAELQGRGSVSLARLAELPAALARAVVVRLAEDASGAYVPQAGERVAELLALGRRGGRAELHVGALAGAVIERGELSMRRLPPRASAVSGSAAPPGGD